jgi:hypothetical protein
MAGNVPNNMFKDVSHIVKNCGDNFQDYQYFVGTRVSGCNGTTLLEKYGGCTQWPSSHSSDSGKISLIFSFHATVAMI